MFDIYTGNQPKRNTCTDA